MLSRSLLPFLKWQVLPQNSANRHMATLKDISIRLKSVKNIQKITKSMKMVSASKYARSERELKQARPIGQSSKVFYEKAKVSPGDDKTKVLLIAMCSDRGLCGACHTTIVKKIRVELKNDVSDAIRLICVGDKARSMLRRQYGDKILFHAKDIGKIPPNFLDASRLCSVINSVDYDFHSGKIMYNRFKSVVAYITQEMPIYTLPAVINAPNIVAYDDIDDDVLTSYLEFSMCAQIFYCMKESACSEQSSRMTAMENATKNAGEMITKLTLTFNRTRQAVITRELIEIISGASVIKT